MNWQEIEDIRWLLSNAAHIVLRDAAASEIPLHRQARRLRKMLSPTRCRLVLQQVALRARAAAKFRHAERMLFTARGLEQATDDGVATYKASRFPEGESVADLCCGIGGDLTGLAKRCDVVACDTDWVAARLAAFNAQRPGQPGVCSPVVADATRLDNGAFVAWHIDPDRRATGRRTTRVAAFQPHAQAIQQLLDRNPDAALKAAPASVLPVPWQQRAELEWISRRRECRQQVAWFGSLAAAHGRRTATCVNASGEVVAQIRGAMITTPPLASRICRFVYEPDAAVLAAGLAGSLADRLDLNGLHSPPAYLTGDTRIDHRLLAGFEVTDVVPFDMRRLRRLFRTRRVGTLEVKKRGVDCDPARVQKALVAMGGNTATLLITRFGNKPVSIVARRLESDVAEDGVAGHKPSAGVCFRGQPEARASDEREEHSG